jgi:hypothetical protein
MSSGMAHDEIELRRLHQHSVYLLSKNLPTSTGVELVLCPERCAVRDVNL